MHSQVWGRIIRGQEHEGYGVLNGAEAVAHIRPATKVGLPPTETHGMRAGRAAQGMVPPVTEERKGIVAVKEIDRAVNKMQAREGATHEAHIPQGGKADEHHLSTVIPSRYLKRAETASHQGERPRATEARDRNRGAPTPFTGLGLGAIYRGHTAAGRTASIMRPPTGEGLLPWVT